MNWDFIIKTFFLSLRGIPVTLSILLVSLLLSFPPALYIALARIKGKKGVTRFSLIYLAVIRSTPSILLILFFYSLLPSLLNATLKMSHINIFDLNPIYYAYIIFSLMTTASLSEIIRSAILTVDKGQIEAALSIGLTPIQSYRRIVFPQALKVALPNLCNLVITIIKGTSLVFVMTIKDITAIAKVEAAYGYHYFEAYFVIFVIYLLLCGGVQFGFSWFDRYLKRV